MAKISDVARRAGVSLSTVSHVVNGTRFVKPETAEAVRKAIAETGYRPNTLARALARATSNSVGIAVSLVSNPYFSDIIRAVELECASLGMQVFIADTNDQPQRELEVVQLLHERRVDGVIVAPCSDSEEGTLAYLAQNKMPTVIIDRLASRKFDQVGVKNAKAVEGLVDHLVSHGHRRIGFIPGQPDFATTRERIEGYLAALRRHGLSGEGSLLATGSGDVESAAVSAMQMLAIALPPTALIAGNNLATIGTMRGLRRAGKQVSKDIALVGFDDFEWADCFEPHLTVVAQPCLEIGRRAAKMLLERIKKPDKAVKTVRLETSLVIRNSCGCE